MCGVFGVCLSGQHRSGRDAVWSREVAKTFFRLSETRGRDSAGLALYDGDRTAVYKEPVSAARFLEMPGFNRLFESSRPASPDAPLVLMGQTRMLTNGEHGAEEDNQPFVRDSLVAVHNGIIVNDQDIWARHGDMTRRAKVDTEVLVALLGKSLKAGDSHRKAFSSAFGDIFGATTAAYFSTRDGVLGVGTNNGSLYWTSNEDGSILLFSSEGVILDGVLSRARLWRSLSFKAGRRLSPGEFLFWDAVSGGLTDGESPRRAGDSANVLDVYPSRLTEKASIKSFESDQGAGSSSGENALALPQEKIDALARCKRCILPVTFPNISFDFEGVCNYCREYKPLTYRGPEDLQKDMVKGVSGKYPDCIVALSGGRDSCYALHYVTKVLGLKPIAYTYDWGMITDIARRNIARMCGKLGVEHILVAADIGKKRENVRKTLQAWLKRPDLGTVPLLMAGDKSYFYFANKLMKQYKINLLVMAENRLERTHFKHGFCGVSHRDSHKTAYDFGVASNISMVLYYLKQFAANPAYLNGSLWDTAWGYMSYYLIPHDYLYFFNYIRWDEKSIIDTLRSEYGWETAADTDTTWRIGDATAAFYNYIYYRIAGFSEHDTFLSNQIREGLISREKALADSRRLNQPRAKSIREYLTVVGLDFGQVVRGINAVPTLY